MRLSIPALMSRILFRPRVRERTLRSRPSTARPFGVCVVTLAAPRALCTARTLSLSRQAMKRLIMLVIPLGILTLTGCVVAPARGYYYHPRAVVVAPAPVVVLRP